MLVWAVPLRDTSPEAEAVQLRVLRSLSDERRLIMALDLSEFLRAMAKARIRQEHPDWTERQVIREIFVLAFFPEPLPEWVP